eukprot:TRINITY_DN13442_c0_g1_i4.p1 TRINITY_DN13442_c0_g1~~TRINITY_DN13442_c0_g1_i4.p1  ORF type:complete len:441 (+),score=25.42 TRINITY_DN13442_c0_g1_i4:136-1323(+)
MQHNLVNLFQQRYKIKLKECWIKNIWKLEYNELNEEDQIKSILEVLLQEDIRICCEYGTLSQFQFVERQRRTLNGMFILQIEEIVNIHEPIKSRYNDNHNKRCLKFILCDGQNKFVGVEHVAVPEFKVDTALGTKILLVHPIFVGNKVLLKPGNVRKLGGMIKYLEDARIRMMSKWKTPRKQLGVEERKSSSENYQQYMQQLTNTAWDGCQQRQMVQEEFANLDDWFDDAGVEQEAINAYNNDNNNQNQRYSNNVHNQNQHFNRTHQPSQQIHSNNYVEVDGFDGTDNNPQMLQTPQQMAMELMDDEVNYEPNINQIYNTSNQMEQSQVQQVIPTINELVQVSSQSPHQRGTLLGVDNVNNTTDVRLTNDNDDLLEQPSAQPSTNEIIYISSQSQ